MSSIITISDVSKAYHIGTARQEANLRETIMSALRSPLRQMRYRMTRLEISVGGDES